MWRHSVHGVLEELSRFRWLVGIDHGEHLCQPQPRPEPTPAQPASDGTAVLHARCGLAGCDYGDLPAPSPPASK
jgi:hypothetical protein